MSDIFFPLLNPIKYYEVAPAAEPQYRSRHFEKYRHADTLKSWQEQVTYGILFQKTDIIWQQIQSDFATTDEVFIQLIEPRSQPAATPPGAAAEPSN